MNTKEMSSFIGEETLTIVDAMERIDLNANGILFIVDKECRLIGSLTDGDIRRWIMNSGKITDSVINAMNSINQSLSQTVML